jgi:hypothetical protein
MKNRKKTGGKKIRPSLNNSSGFHSPLFSHGNCQLSIDDYQFINLNLF